MRNRGIAPFVLKLRHLRERVASHSGTITPGTLPLYPLCMKFYGSSVRLDALEKSSNKNKPKERRTVIRLEVTSVRRFVIWMNDIIDGKIKPCCGGQFLYVLKMICEALSIYCDFETPLKWLVSHRKAGCRIPGKRLGLVHTLTGTASLGLARILRRD